MDLSKVFIDRPILASVVSLVIFVAGAIAVWFLPISEYPEVVPPSVQVRALYPGANPKVLAETVASPLEEAINGVENMLYMGSQSTANGAVLITVTFKVGTNIDQAQVQVQNRVSQALPRLPEATRTLGVTTQKSSPDLTMVVHLVSPDNRYDTLYLRNYAVLNVKDVIARIDGVGQAILFGGGDYSMRIWLDPKKVSARGLAAGDVVRAIREQNVQVAAGVVGGQPSNGNAQFELLVNARGRLASEEEFGEIIIKTGNDGSIVRLRDVARIELAAGDYSLRSLLNNKAAVALPIFQAPGSNSLELSNNVRRTMEELKKNFPPGVDYSIVYDPTQFTRESIRGVVTTLLEAVLLVVLVVVLFLQTWRASIIPLLAVPVSVVGTFAVMLAAGFSINALSLFGLVLAIGIVVDDAIVVVENVERNIENGFSPREAAHRAMEEVSGPIIAIALVLCAVFIPIAFISGLSGQFYRQFALTIAISTVISAINSLTLSPALAAILLQPHGAKKDWFGRLIDTLFGWIFRPFNWFFSRASNRYAGGVARVVRRKTLSLIVYAVLIGCTVVLFEKVPGGFVPAQDKGYLIGFAQLPDGSTLDRSEEIIRRMSTIALDHPGVENSIAFPGLSIAGFTNSSNAGVVFFGLKPFAERKGPGQSGFAIAGALNQKLQSIEGAFVLVLPPPPVAGLGTTGGFKMQLEDRAGLGYEALYAATQALLGRTYAPDSGIVGAFSGYQINVPQLNADLDRVKAKRLGVGITDVFDTMQIYLGSLYVNDFNRFGRTYQVRVQADAEFRTSAEDIRQLRVRNSAGEMVPLGTIMTVTPSYGPERVQRYNAYLSADINGNAAPGVSSGQAQQIMERLAAETLPNGITYEWTELTYQQILAGNTTMYVFPLCVLLVFLVLAAQYESWTLPLAVILIVPMGVLAAIFGVWAFGRFGYGGDNNIFTQIALFVLVGLACKNAILIVEFARELEMRGRSYLEAAVESARLRLRPILMTSFAFIMGVIPLVIASGPGAEMRQAMGVAVFTGMIGVTFFGLFLTPVFYVLIRAIVCRFSGNTSPCGGTPPPHDLGLPPGPVPGAPVAPAASAAPGAGGGHG
jgi:multidrug efflux pump